MKYKPYPAYKDSGVDWLGEVPQHWEVKPLKYLASCNDDVLPESTDPETEFEYVDISSVSSVNGIEKTESMRFESAPSRARRRVKAGDVIISTVRTYLKAIAPITEQYEHAIVSTGFAVIRPKPGYEPSFACYALHANYFMDQVVARSAGVSYPAINASELTAIKVATPTRSEQSAIAAVLNRETAKLDTLIAKQEKLIELLQEKRQALISHAVTKGLNPDAPMKDSGVEWLGMVPAHWEVGALRWKSGCASGYAIANEDMVKEKDDLHPVPVIGANGIIGYTRVSCIETTVLSVGRVGACGNVHIVSSPAWITDNALVLRPNPNKLRISYIAAVLTARNLNDIASKTAQPLITGTQLLDQRIPAPPLEEQDSLIAFMNTEQAKIDVLIEKSRRSIELMREHRTSLISAAVTGKIDVRV